MIPARVAGQGRPIDHDHPPTWRERFHTAWEYPRGIVLTPADLTLTRDVFAGRPVEVADLADLTERMEAAATSRVVPCTLPTVPTTGGTGWPAPHHHAPGFLASCTPCIRGEAHTP